MASNNLREKLIDAIPDVGCGCGNRVVLFVLFLLDTLLFTMPMPILLSPNVHADVSLYLVFGAKPLFTLITCPLAAAWVDRSGPKGIMFLSVILMFVCALMFSAALLIDEHKFVAGEVIGAILISARVLHGIASALLSTATLAFAILAFHEGGRTFATACSIFGMAVGILFGPLLASGLVKIVLPSLIFAGAATFIFVWGICLWFILHGDHLRPRLPEDEGVRYNIWRDKMAWTIAINNAVAYGAIALMLPMVYLTQESIQDVKSPFQIRLMSPIIIILCTATSYLVTICLIPLFDHYYNAEKWRFLTVGMCLVAAGMGVVTRGRRAWVPLVSLMIVGAGVALVQVPSVPLLAQIVKLHGSYVVGRAAAVQMMAISFASLIIPPFTPMLMESKWFVLEWVFLGFCFISIVVVVPSTCLRTKIPGRKSFHASFHEHASSVVRDNVINSIGAGST